MTGQESRHSTRMTVQEIADRLAIGEMAVYRMLADRQIPAIRVGKRWLVTRYAYEQWERNCGMSAAAAPQKVQ